MKEFLCFVMSVVGAVVLWRWLVGWTTRRGWKLSVSRIVALPITMVAWFLGLGTLFAVVATDKGEPSAASTPAVATLSSAKPQPAKPVAADVPAKRPATAAVFDVMPSQLMVNINRALHIHAKGELEHGSKLDTYQANLGHDMHLVAGVDKSTGKVANLVVIAPYASGESLEAQAARAGDVIGAAMPLGTAGTAAHQVEEMAKEQDTFGNKPYRLIDTVNIDYRLDETVGMLVSADLEPRKRSAELDGDPEGYVYPQCKQAVEQQLKSPSTADFPWTADKVARNPNDPNSFVVLGHVDAQNAFGATLRADWICQISYAGGDRYSSRSFALGKVLLQER